MSINPRTEKKSIEVCFTKIILHKENHAYEATVMIKPDKKLA